MEVKATIDEARQAVWNLRHATGESSSIPALFQYFGIIGMRERVEQVGGRLAIESGPGQGTLVSARVPLPRR